MNRWIALGASALLLACGGPPPAGTTPTPTTTTAPTTSSSSSSSTTFPYDTGFGGPNDQEPDHWLLVSETGTWNLTPPGGPFTDFTGTLTLMEIVDELDKKEGPDCLATWDWSGTETPIGVPCTGCDVSFDITFALSTGDPSTCRSPDMPTENMPWRLAWDSSEGRIYRDMGFTGVWVPWYTATQIGDSLDLMFLTSWPIYVDEDM